MRPDYDSHVADLENEMLTLSHVYEGTVPNLCHGWQGCISVSNNSNPPFVTAESITLPFCPGYNLPGLHIYTQVISHGYTCWVDSSFKEPGGGGTGYVLLNKGVLIQFGGQFSKPFLCYRMEAISLLCGTHAD